MIPLASKKQDDVQVKAYFIPRFIAYLIDIILIVFPASFLFSFLPQSENVMKLQEQSVQLQESYVKNEITSEEYVAQTLDLSYDMAYQNVAYVIIEVSFIVCYFVIYQCKNNGQTLGKKLMKVRVVSIDSNHELSMNQYLYRVLILQSVALNLLSLIGVLIFSKSIYGAFSTGLGLLQYTVWVITFIMVLYRKDGRGVHDMIAGTRVVMDGSKERVLCEN